MEDQNLQHDHKTNVAATLKPSDSLKTEQWSLTEHLLENTLNLTSVLSTEYGLTIISNARDAKMNNLNCLSQNLKQGKEI